jgi:hypothetical protein
MYTKKSKVDAMLSEDRPRSKTEGATIPCLKDAVLAKLRDVSGYSEETSTEAEPGPAPA